MAPCGVLRNRSFSSSEYSSGIEVRVANLRRCSVRRTKYSIARTQRDYTEAITSKRCLRQRHSGCAEDAQVRCAAGGGGGGGRGRADLAAIADPSGTVGMAWQSPAHIWPRTPKDFSYSVSSTPCKRCKDRPQRPQCARSKGRRLRCSAAVGHKDGHAVSLKPTRNAI